MADRDGGAFRAGRPGLERVTSVGDILGRIVSGRAKHVRLVEEVQRVWPAVVGPARARISRPWDLVAGTLFVSVATPHAAQELRRMLGNIQRAFKARWDVEIRDIRVVFGPPPSRPKVSGQGPGRRHATVELTEEEIRRFREQCPPTLTPEAAEALAHLRAFFVRRFGG